MKFPPFGNEFLPSSTNIILKGNRIFYLSKQNDICDYNPRCLILSGLAFNDIIMYMIRNKVLAYHVLGVYSYFTNVENNIIYVYRGPLQEFYRKKGTHESLDVVCPNFNVKRIKTIQYLSNILKCDTLIDDTK